MTGHRIGGSVAAGLLAALFAACGHGGGTNPAGPTTSAAPSLDQLPGHYSLSVTMSTTGDCVAGPSGTGCVTGSLCSSIGGAAIVDVSVATSVHAELSGDTLVVRPDNSADTFRMDLHLAGATLTGTASGTYESGGFQLSVFGNGAGTPADATGTVTPPFLTGRLDGMVQINGSACANNGHTWRLTRMP